MFEVWQQTTKKVTTNATARQYSGQINSKLIYLVDPVFYETFATTCCKQPKEICVGGSEWDTVDA